jgi:mannose-6-phosphate isomerase-like protein (cupin superfamily)
MAPIGCPRQADGMTHQRASDPLVLQPDGGEVIEILGNRLVIKAAAPRVTLVDYTAPPGFAGPPLHVHPGFDEVFLVLEGVLTALIGDVTHEVGPGCTVFVPGDAPHTFTNATDEPLRVLVVLAPGGFEDYFRGLAEGDDELIARATARAEYAPAGQMPSVSR